jgi:DNA-binding NarL/FixJ family response regulator
MAARILIVDDHEVVRQGVRTILKSRPQWEIVGEAANGKQAVEQAEKLDADVIIMDITMPEMSGIEATREIAKLKLRSAVLIFTMHESKNLADTVREAGARGFVLKSHASRDLLEALEVLLDGGSFFGRDAAKPQQSNQGTKPSATFSVRVRPV